MKVRIRNAKVMELYSAVTGALKQETENDRRFNYAMDRNAALLTSAVRLIRKKDAENLKGYYEAVDKVEEAAKAAGKELDQATMDGLKVQFKDGFDKNAAMLSEVREIDLYEIKFEWLPAMPGFIQRVLALITSKPSDIELGQPEIKVPEGATEELDN
jgi:hypothetical protein